MVHHTLQRLQTLELQRLPASERMLHGHLPKTTIELLEPPELLQAETVVPRLELILAHPYKLLLEPFGVEKDLEGGIPRGIHEGGAFGLLLVFGAVGIIAAVLDIRPKRQIRLTRRM